MTFDFKKFKDDLLFVPLGGSSEIGMNLNLYTYQGKWLMIDCGIGFASDYLPGVDIVVPDISFIAERKEDLLGLVITHAHEDHLGAVPHLWRDLECPIYATPFTSCFLKHKLSEMGAGKKPEINEIQTGSKLELGPFSMEMVDLTHSIPEMQAVAITTPKGVVMHTGDWKFDGTPMIGPVSDYEALEKYGDGKVLAMVCDSTNVFEQGESGSEGEVRKNLVKAIASCKKRVVVTTFASNLARVASVIMAAQEAGRVVALAGRSLYRIVDAARESGYLSEDIEFINEKEIGNLSREDVVVLCTGCQGEPRAALTRMARGDHPNVRLVPGDTVIFSSRKIPGNESRISWVMNQLTLKKIEIITDRDIHIHVSGHPARDELKRMYELVRPQIAVPTHGEARHLHEHAKLAKSLGAKETVEAYNGAVIWLEPGEASVIGNVESGYIAIDGTSLIPTDSDIIRMRRKLRDDGAVFVSVTLDEKGALAVPIHIAAPGVLDKKEDAEIFEEWSAELTDMIENVGRKETGEKLREKIRIFMRQLIKRELSKRPVIEVSLASL